MDAGYTFVYFRLLLWHKNIFVSPCRTEKKTLDLQLGIKKKISAILSLFLNYTSSICLIISHNQTCIIIIIIF